MKLSFEKKKIYIYIERENREEQPLRWVPNLRDLGYEERLQKLQLPTLAGRRDRGDMMMVYKCAEGIEKIDVNEYVIPSQSSLRGHSKKLYKKKG